MVIGQSAATFLLAKLGISTERVLSMLLVNQPCVGVAKLGVFALASLLHPLPGWMQRGVMGLVISLLVLFLAGAVTHGLRAKLVPRISSRMPRLGRLFGALSALTPAHVLLQASF
jgi:hypothetical protein